MGKVLVEVATDDNTLQAFKNITVAGAVAAAATAAAQKRNESAQRAFPNQNMSARERERGRSST